MVQEELKDIYEDITWYYVISHDITSYHMISRHITSYYMIFSHEIFSVMTSYHVISHDIQLWNIFSVMKYFPLFISSPEPSNIFSHEIFEPFIEVLSPQWFKKNWKISMKISHNITSYHMISMKISHDITSYHMISMKISCDIMWYSVLKYFFSHEIFSIVHSSPEP